MRTKFTRSSRKHRIGRAHALHVMNTVEPTRSINDRGETEYLWIGADDRGVDLEIVGVVIAHDDLLLILHVMPHNYRRN